MSNSNTPQPTPADELESAIDAVERRQAELAATMQGILSAVAELPRQIHAANTALNELRELLEESERCSSPTTPNSPPTDAPSEASSSNDSPG